MDDRLRILDTDIISLWQRNPEHIDPSLTAYPPDQRAEGLSHGSIFSQIP